MECENGDGKILMKFREDYARSPSNTAAEWEHGKGSCRDKMASVVVKCWYGIYNGTS
jgi:hypothetical protein